MAYNEGLLQVIREETAGIKNLEEKKMFGGIAFMLNGNMSVGVHKDSLIVRVGKENRDKFINEPHVKDMDFTGKVMKGWMEILPDAHSEEKVLKKWIKRGIEFASTLPKK